MLHRKPHIENHLESAQKKLAARLELLSTADMAADQIQRDAKVRHFTAQISKAKRELRNTAAIETQTAEKAELRVRKEAAAKAGNSPEKSKKRDVNAPPAKKRKKPRVELDDAEQAGD